MIPRKTFTALCLAGALSCGSVGVSAQSTNPTETIQSAQLSAMPPAAAEAPARSSNLRVNVPAAQADPVILALFGAAAVGLGLYLRRYLTH